MSRKVAAPGDTCAGAIAHHQANNHRVALQIGAGGGTIESQGLASGHQLVLAQPQGHQISSKGHTGPAGGGHDPAPVGVAAMHGAFHQRRAAHGAGNGTSAGVIGSSLHLHLDQAGGALAIAGDRLGQVLRHRRQAGLQRFVVLVA